MRKSIQRRSQRAMYTQSKTRNGQTFRNKTSNEESSISRLAGKRNHSTSNAQRNDGKEVSKKFRVQEEERRDDRTRHYEEDESEGNHDSTDSEEDDEEDENALSIEDFAIPPRNEDKCSDDASGYGATDDQYEQEDEYYNANSRDPKHMDTSSEAAVEDLSMEFINDTREGDNVIHRKRNLMNVYGEGRGTVYNDNTMRILTNSVRKVIIPQIKFVSSKKGFGSFDQPNFADRTCWVNKLFANITTLKMASDRMKAEIWMTYKTKIKEQFSLHRAAATLKIKRKFMEGK